MTDVDIRSIVDRAPLNRFHGVILFWCIFILICDGYDLAIVGAALPAIMDDMQVSPTGAGIMAGAALVGTALGAIFLGTLADRIGRPKMLAICIALFSLFTAAAGFADDPTTFSILRFVAGLGIGGVLPITTAQMSEFAPERWRARMVTIVFAGYSVGGIIVALTSKLLISSYGWQSVFFVAVVPVLIIPFILRSMPESMAYLAHRERHEDLLAIGRRISPSANLLDGTRFSSVADTAKSATVTQLFQENRGISTVMIWVAFMTGLFMVYALNSWLTKLMAMAGYSLGSALNFVIVFNVGSIFGAIFGGWLSDKLNKKHVLVAFYVTGAVSLAALAYASNTFVLFALVFIVGASTLGTQLVAYAYAGGYYPASIRATGVGFASGIGRIGAIFGPVLIGWLVSLNLPLEQNFLVIGLAGLIGGVAVMLVDQNRSDAATLRQAVS